MAPERVVSVQGYHRCIAVFWQVRRRLAEQVLGKPRFASVHSARGATVRTAGETRSRAAR